MAYSFVKHAVRPPWRTAAFSVTLVSSMAVGIVAGSAPGTLADAAPPVSQSISCNTVPTREPDLCATIEVGGATYRYAFLRPAGPIRELMLLDPGGPGMSALASGGVGRVLGALGIAELPAGIGALMVEEPWVTRPLPSADCVHASMEYLDALADVPRISKVASEFKARCANEEYGWSPARYRDVVAAISSRIGAPVTRFAGASFAAYRLAWLANDARFHLRSAALANPLLPELRFDQVLRHQAVEMEKIAGQFMRNEENAKCPKGELYAAAASLLPLVSEGFAAPEVRPGTLHKLAADYIGRYGSKKLALGRLAYFQELCAAGVAPDSRQSVTAPGSALAFLQAIHAGCGTRPEPSQNLLNTHIKLCTTFSDQDAVVPSEALRALGVQPISTMKLPHLDISGLSSCRDSLLRDEGNELQDVEMHRVPVR